MTNLSVPDWLHYILIAAYCVNLITAIVLSVGWLTCANYYFKVRLYIDEIGVGIFIMFVIIISFMLFCSSYSYNDTMSIGVLSTNALLIAAVSLLVLTNWLFNSVISLRSYFANKRGRT
jgi:hypothetical protein